MSNTAFIVQKQDDLTSNDFLNFVIIDNGDGTRSLYFRDQASSGLPGLASQITSSGFNSLSVPGGVTTAGLTVGRIPKATTALVIGDSIISEAAGVITIAGSLLLTTPLAVGQGGTGTATAFTAGSVVFADGAGVYAQNNSRFFWDNTNNFLGLGTNAPTAFFHAVGAQPAAVGTTPGTAATNTITVTGGAGGNTTIATTGVGGAGSTILFTGGAGGTAASALTASTGGVGGGFALTAGAGGAAAVDGTGTNTGGAGASLQLLGAAGGAATGATSGTNTGGTGSSINVTAGAGGAANTGSGTNAGGVGGSVSITGGTGGVGSSTTGAGGAVTVSGGPAGAAAGAGAPGTATMQGGAASSTGSGSAGGSVAISGRNAGGDGTVARAGGTVTITVGDAVGPQAGAAFTVNLSRPGTNTATGTQTGSNGGAWSLSARAGGTATAAEIASTGGIGSALSWTLGTGGAAAVAGTGTNTGGAGGAFSVTGGTGGAATGVSSGASTGGVGGAISMTGGVGGAANSGSGTMNAAAGGAVTISGGTGGIGTSLDGAGGAVTIKGGVAGGATGAPTGGALVFQTTNSNAAVSTRLTIAANGNVSINSLTAQAFLYSGASSVLTSTAAAAKGDLLLGTGSTLQILPVGANGTVLTADSTQATGARWATAPPTISGSPAATNVAVFTSATDITGTALFVHTTTTGQTTLVSDAGSTFRSMKFQAGGASAPVGFEISNNTPNYVSRYALARGSAQFMTGSSAGDVCLTASGGSLRMGANASAGTDPAGTALAINATNCNFWDTAVTGGTFRVTSDSNTTLVTAASVGPWGHIIQAGTGATITFRLRNSTPANCADLGRCGSVNDFITGTAVGDIVLRAMGGALHMGVNATADTPPTAIGFTLDANGGGTFLGFVDDAGTSRVSTQFDKTSDTALANITGLTATLLAGISYSFEAYLMTTSNVAGGVQAAIAGTATATAIRYEGILVDANVNAGQARATALGGAVAAVTAVTAATITIKGTITVNAAGTLTVQFAQNASNGAASSVLVGSWFKVWRNN